MRSVIRAILMALCLASCAGLEFPTDPEDRGAVAEGTTITHDRHQQIYEAEGPLILDQEFFRTLEACGGLICNHAWSLYTLRAWDKDRSFPGGGAQLYIEARFNIEWAFLESAWTEGRRLPLRVIERQVEACDPTRFAVAADCDLTEIVGIDFTREELEAMASTGLDAKVQGARDSFVIEVPAAYFGGFLDAVERRSAP